ncbi:hypothetical protein B484DRAFT_391004 [Ochromonadaceae sp. CCMP2298]|nr:hypothetical protein B484DRAFT_391004 [Ochromonadaceae sp. CCMP2298]
MSERLSLGAPDTGAGAGGGPGAENRTLEWNNLEEEYHLAYAAVNKIFARTLLGLLDNRDVVWVHDYHLMSLPKLLREAVGKNAQAKCGFKHDDTDKDSRNVSSTTTDAFEKINTELRRPLTAPADLHDIKIIFFMHIPFPTSQIFRTLTRATELLESMCSADVVGFHAFDHARHFLNATKRMLGIRSGSRPGGLLTLNVQDREVIVTVSHVSIETVRIAQAAAHPETQRIARELREKHAGKRIIAGIDVCQRLSGVALKLAAFDKMLSDSSWGKRGNIVLLQRVVRTGSRPGDEATTASDLRKMVDDINGKYVTSAAASAARMMGQRSSEECLQTSLVSPSASASASTSSSSDTPAVQPTSLDVLDYAELTSAPNIHERMAFWLVADVILLTPIREGLNLYPLEYIYARREMPNPGVVVVSEFSTCSALLNGSLKINPFAPLHVADALEKALMLSTKDKDLRRQRDLPFISSHPSSLWTQHILNDLEALQPSGGGAGGRGQSDQQYPVPLDTKKMLSCYESAAHNAGICDRASRVFVLDYGGTLLPKEKYDIYIKRQTLSAIAGRKPSAGMMAALKELSDDPRNVVMVVTGLTKLKLGDTFQGLHNLTLATSNGLVYSWGLNLLPPTHVLRSREVQAPTLTLPSKRVRKESPPQSAQQQQQGQDTKDATGPNGDGKGDLLLQSLADEERDWGFLACNIDWRGVSDIAIPIITKFTYRTNGTCQTPRIPGIGWSYFGADPEEGYKQSKQLKLELEAALARFDVQITSLIQGSIEVVPRTLHKGLLVRPLLEKVCQMRGGRLPGLLCVVGDEESDDKMINVVYDVLSNAPANADVRRCKAFTVTVARRVCPAQFYVNDVEDVEELLASLAASDTTIPAPTTTTPSAPFASAPGPTDAMPDMRHEVTASFL